ncbi:MAG: DNA repair protein RadC [Anaeroplasmataceae bacterium]|nr:DNA repair protein RadC [Anaeroplasmataceae bacterium]
MNIKDLKITDRPRERLEKLGAQALSDVELLAILIGSGTKNHTVLDISSQILQSYSLSELKDLSYDKLARIHGIKRAKACLLMACFELARRSSIKNQEHLSLEKPKDIYDYIYGDVYLESTEIVIFILVDCKLKPIKKYVFRGDSTSQVDLPIKRIVYEALEWKAYGVILAHNHPSGDVVASSADIETTRFVQQILASLDILFLDHLVVSNKEYYSMEEHGILSTNQEYSVLGDILEKNFV